MSWMCSDTNGFSCSGLLKRMIFEKKKKQDFAIWVLLHRGRRCHPIAVLMKDCKVSFFKSAFNFSLKSKTASSASATLKYSQIIHGDLPSREKAFLFLWIFCFKKDSSLEMSFDDILKVSRYLIVENLEMWPQFCFGDCIWCLQLGTGLREIHLSCPNHCFCRTTCTWRHFTSKNRSSAPKNWKQLRTKNVQLSLSWKRNMSPIVRSRPSTN